MLTSLAKLLKALNSQSSARQIAFALALGMVVGLTPTYSLHNAVLLLLAFLLTINLSTFFLSTALFSLISLPLSAVFARFGERLLTADALQGMWQWLYQFDVLKLLHWHNTLTLGSLVCAALLFVPLYMLAKIAVVRYRHHVKQFVQRFKLVQMLKGSRFYRIYQSLTGEVGL